MSNKPVKLSRREVREKARKILLGLEERWDWGEWEGKEVVEREGSDKEGKTGQEAVELEGSGKEGESKRGAVVAEEKIKEGAAIVRKKAEEEAVERHEGSGRKSKTKLDVAIIEEKAGEEAVERIKEGLTAHVKKGES